MNSAAVAIQTLSPLSVLDLMITNRDVLLSRGDRLQEAQILTRLFPPDSSWFFWVQVTKSGARMCVSPLSQQCGRQLRVVWCPPAGDGVPGWCSTETFTLHLLIQTAQVAAFSHLRRHEDSKRRTNWQKHWSMRYRQKGTARFNWRQEFALHQTELGLLVCRDGGWESQGRASPSGASGRWWGTACLRPLGLMPGRRSDCVKPDFLTLCGGNHSASSSGLTLYRGSGHPGDGHSVDDNPVIVRQCSHVWVGPASGVVIGMGREDFSHGF